MNSDTLNIVTKRIDEQHGNNKNKCIKHFIGNNFTKEIISYPINNDKKIWKKAVDLDISKVKLDDIYEIGPKLSICNSNTPDRPVLIYAVDKKTMKRVVIKKILAARVPNTTYKSMWLYLCELFLNLPNLKNIMKIYNVFYDKTAYYVVMENLEGGELFDFFLSERAIPEETCKSIMRQILRSVEVLHSLKILHRDIKPENLMFRFNKPLIKLDSKKVNCFAPDFELVLIDFDTCKVMDQHLIKQPINPGKRRLVGTFGYLAPEVLLGGDYSTASDMWSIGIILYILMTGIPPLKMDCMTNFIDSVKVIQELKSVGIKFDQEPLNSFPMARNLCMSLLHLDPNKRLSDARVALRHPWLYNKKPKVQIPKMPKFPEEQCPSKKYIESPALAKKINSKTRYIHVSTYQTNQNDDKEGIQNCLKQRFLKLSANSTKGQVPNINTWSIASRFQCFRQPYICITKKNNITTEEALQKDFKADKKHVANLAPKYSGPHTSYSAS